MKRIFPLLVMGCLLTTSLAQQKSGRDFYEEAKKAGALPLLPYVCFRSTTETSQNKKEEKYDDPTFAMLGSSQQIADLIKMRNYRRMSDADREKIRELRDTDYLYVQAFTHGVAGGSHVFYRKDPSDPSRADWVFEGTTPDDKKTSLKWEFNINWGSLRFREKLSGTAGYLIFYGQCELVGK